MSKKNQSKRLTSQHKKDQGVVGIFGDKAKLHDIAVGEISHLIIEQLKEEYPQLSFQYKKGALSAVDALLLNAPLAPWDKCYFGFASGRS